MRIDSCAPVTRVRRTVLMNTLAGLFLFLVTFESWSQESGSRPGIGLVLSGGGAHGIAHLGVIKVMEEAGLRPDYITGVSMGSIIGGMYSLGYTADSIYSILRTIDWETLLSNRIPENKIVYPEKSHAYNSVISLPVSSAKLRLPSGLINGQLIENTLNYYFWPAADIQDFSKLPIPFMCVGSDIISFRKVDLKTGFLPEAVRASISVPSIFTPLRLDTLLLIDGGLIRNFAASEAREMGARILIGSYAGFHAYREEDLRSLSGIIKQVALYRSLEDFNSEKKLVDILVTHNIRNYSKADFVKADSIYRRGYNDALPYRDKFKRLADSLNSLGEQEPLKNILGRDSYRIDRVEIEGSHIYSKDQISGILEIEPGQLVTKTDLFNKIELLYGRSWFEKVSYRMLPRNDSLILIIECEEKPGGMIYGAVHYDNYLRAGIQLGFTFRNLLTRSSEISLSSSIGQYYMVDVNATQLLGKDLRQAALLRFYSDNTLLPMLGIMGETGAVISRNFMPEAGISRTIGLNQLMKLSLTFENTNLVPQFDSEKLLRNLAWNYLTPAIEYHINTLDSKHFPDRGLVLDIGISASKLLSTSVRSDSSAFAGRWIKGRDFSSDRFFTTVGHLMYCFSPSGKTTVSLGGDLLLNLMTDSLSAGNSFRLMGGQESISRRSIPFTGYHANELATDRMAAFRTSLDLEFVSDVHLELMANIAVAELRGCQDGFKIFTGYGLGIGYMSVAGPLRAGLMYGDRSCHRYFSDIKGYLSMGFRF